LRNSSRLDDFSDLQMPVAHPLFRVVEGGVASWEKI
jgi:hypothetical protein